MTTRKHKPSKVPSLNTRYRRALGLIPDAAWPGHPACRRADRLWELLCEERRLRR